MNGQTDTSRAWTDTLNVSDSAEMANVSHGDDVNTYLGARGTKHGVRETDGIGSQTDVSTWHGDVSSVETDANVPAEAPEIISIPQMQEKLLDLPMETTRGHPDEPNGCGNHVDGLSTRTDVHTTEDKTQMAVNKTENVRKCQIDSKP